MNSYLLDYQTRSAADEISRRYESAMENARRISSNQRLTFDAKAGDIATLTASAADEIESYAAPLVGDLEAEIKRLELAATPSRTPDATEIAQVSYVRDALAMEWQTMSIKDALAAWERAIEAGDRIQARVYRDFYSPVYREHTAEALRSTFPNATAASVEDSPDIKALKERTDDLLSTESERVARKQLGEMRERLASIGSARDYALGQLRHARFDATRGVAVDVLRHTSY